MTSHDFRPSADRSDRALLAYVQQELSAPAEAIAGYAEILLDEAERNGHGEFRDDLEKIHAASHSLIDVIASLVSRSREPTHGPGEDSEDYRRHLRHDLRTPINAIKGYGEMLREDAAGIDDAQALVSDLNRLLEEASRLLERIDGLVSFSLPETEARRTPKSARDLSPPWSLIASSPLSSRSQKPKPTVSPYSRAASSWSTTTRPIASS